MNNNDTKNVSSTEVFIDGKFYTLRQLQRYIKFYNEHQIERGQTCCPLCGAYYDENELFVCDECEELLPTDEQCREHEHIDMKVCQECCDRCQKQKAYEDDINQKIDEKRGK